MLGKVLPLLICLGFLCVLGSLCWQMIMAPRKYKATRLREIQERLRVIHITLTGDETTILSRQSLFTELYDLMLERRQLLDDDFEVRPA